MTEATCAGAVGDMVYSCLELGIPLTPVQQQQFIRYCSLIRHVNESMNLTALRSPEQIAQGLFLDSLTLALALPQKMRTGESPVRMVDVGPGAGVPGLPLKILFPHWSLTMIESVGKKARFIETTAQDLQLANVRVLAVRAEEAGREANLRDAADLCVARAVAALPTLLELCAPFVRPGGLLLFPKSGDVQSEVASAARAAKAVRVELRRVQPIPEVTGLQPGHVIAVYEKVAPTPKQYPRRTGLPKSQPL